MKRGHHDLTHRSTADTEEALEDEGTFQGSRIEFGRGLSLSVFDAVPEIPPPPHLESEREGEKGKEKDNET